MRALLSLLAALALAGAAQAQTTGVPFLNDYRLVPGGVSGSTSALTIDVPCGTPDISFEVSTSPGALVTHFFAFCPADPGNTPLAPSGCPIPFTAASGTTNQSVDLDLGCAFNMPPIVADADGLATLGPIPLNPSLCGLSFSTQASVFAPWRGNLLVTQAYDVNL